MTSLKEKYAELISLTKTFLLREHSLIDIKVVDPLVLSFFQTKMGSFLPAPKKTYLYDSFQAAASPAINTSPAADIQPPEILPSPIPPVKPEPTIPSPLPPIKPAEPPSPELKPPAIYDKNALSKTHPKTLPLEPLTEKIATRDTTEFWKIFPTLFPDISLCESIPPDTMAQKIKNTWLNNQVTPSIVILSFHDDEKQLAFLKNVAKAISLYLAPARVITAHLLEKENNLDRMLASSTLRLIIASDYNLYLHPQLMRFYREIPGQGRHFLQQIPLLLLSDIALYLKDPQLKSLLWRAICNEFAASQKNLSI